MLEEVPYREKPLRAALRERGVGRLTIKKRGVSVVPEELRKRLSLRGDEEATLVLTRVAGKGTALLVEPLGDERVPAPTPAPGSRRPAPYGAPRPTAAAGSPCSCAAARCS